MELRAEQNAHGRDDPDARAELECLGSSTVS
jgi:hypothetical protein